MKTIKTHVMRNAILVALPLLVGGAALANMKTPVSSSLLLRALNREALSISREHNAGVLKSVFEVFDPSLRSFLTSVPIVLDPLADTAKAYPAKGYIGVSPEWDNIVYQSKHRAIYEQRVGLDVVRLKLEITRLNVDYGFTFFRTYRNQRLLSCACRDSHQSCPQQDQR